MYYPSNLSFFFFFWKLIELGLASMLNYSSQSQMKEVGDAIYAMLQDPAFKMILESKV
jgi:hypothetical protein